MLVVSPSQPVCSSRNSMFYVNDMLSSCPQESFKDLVCIPALPLVPVKRNRKEKEGDRFPKEARNQKMLLEQEEENNKLKQLEEDSRKKRMFKKE